MNKQPLEQFGAITSIGDGIAIAGVIGVLLQLLPPLAAAATLLWTIIRIYETETIQGWIQAWKGRKNDR